MFLYYFIPLLPFLTGTFTTVFAMCTKDQYSNASYFLLIFIGVCGVIIGVIVTGIQVYNRLMAKDACRQYNIMLRKLKDGSIPDSDKPIVVGIMNDFLKACKEDIKTSGRLSQWYGLGIENVPYVTLKYSDKVFEEFE